jgi:hypothetical protein
MGKGLLPKMMAANEYLGFMHHFEYATLVATNIKSGNAAEKLRYEKVSEVNLEEISINGVFHFRDVD